MNLPNVGVVNLVITMSTNRHKYARPSSIDSKDVSMQRLFAARSRTESDRWSARERAEPPSRDRRMATFEKCLKLHDARVRNARRASPCDADASSCAGGPSAALILKTALTRSTDYAEARRGARCRCPALAAHGGTHRFDPPELDRSRS